MLLGAALGATLIAPVSARVAGPDDEPTALQTRAASCAGLNVHPIDDLTTYGYGVTNLHRAQGTSGSAFFHCHPGLPHNARVTKVRFTVADFVLGRQILNCALARHGLTEATADSYQVMAGALGTSRAECSWHHPSRGRDHRRDGQQQGVRLLAAVPDRGRMGEALSIYGADVTYTIDSGNG